MRARWTAVVAAWCLFGALSAMPVARASAGDPLSDRQWGLARIGAKAAWTTADGAGVVIAIVDSGVDLTHPDLVDQLLVIEGSDFVDPLGPCTKATINKTCTPDGPQDEEGHGTHVAGIAGASTGNGIGVAGTAPGAQLLPVRVLDENNAGTTADLADGIRFAVDHGAQIVNLSLSYDVRGHLANYAGQLRPVRAAIEYAAGKGAVVVAAAGNGALSETSAPPLPLCAEPAAAPTVLCVGAVGPDDLPAYYTNTDVTPNKAYLVAPGGDGLACESEILSTYLRGAETLCSAGDGYEAMSGTSMAAPFVSGVAALLASKGLTSAQITGCITRTATDLGLPGRDPVFGHGLLNAARAVTSC